MSSGAVLADTPLVSFPRISRLLGIDLWVKRDDLFPMVGGGSKGRKANYILRQAQALGCNAVVTTGGTQSNHARAIAIAAAALGWRCKLVLHGDVSQMENPTGNLLLMLLAGAEIKIVAPQDISTTMRTAVLELRSEGYNPREVPGGGHSIEGALAYLDATVELISQCQNASWTPELLVLASGTGGTQAGIVAGLHRLGWHIPVVGVSVARRNPRGSAAVAEMVIELSSGRDTAPQSDAVDFRDEWVGEGYERANERVLATIMFAARTEGLILDPTYTGKAFLALMDLVESGEIPGGSHVLFWHTGGLLNLIASGAFAGALST